MTKVDANVMETKQFYTGIEPLTCDHLILLEVLDATANLSHDKKWENNQNK